jgi:hypothetical protein
VDPGLLDVLHHAAEVDLLAVGIADAIDVDLDGVVRGYWSTRIGFGRGETWWWPRAP